MPRTPLEPRFTVEYLSILGLLCLAVLAYGTFKRGAGQPIRIFGAVWFFTSYLPISNLVQLNATAAERTAAVANWRAWWQTQVGK